MNCLFPYKATVGNVIKEYKSTHFSNNRYFDKYYMIKKVFKELIEYLHVDEKLQKQEIQKALKNNQFSYDWLAKELNVLIGSLYEQEIADIFINYQLTPDFTNSIGRFVNMTDFDKMKMPDIIVQSFKDNTYHAFDVKSGIVWRKMLSSEQIEKNPIYVYNTGITVKKLNELYFSFKYKTEKMLNSPVHIYILFVCYDMLTKVNFEHQAEYYQLAFNDNPDSAEKVCFVIDIEKLFVDDEIFIGDKIFNKQSPYLLKLEDEVEYDDIKTIFNNKYAIRIDSPVSMTLRNFIYSFLI